MDKVARQKLTRARAGLVVQQPFWGVLALNLRPIERADIETMGTDGESLFYSPMFVRSLGDPELRGVIAHEVEHVARCHHTRRGRRNPGLWNEAADYVINADLLAGGFKLPKDGLVDPQYKGMSAEAVYAKRARDAAKQQAQQPKGQPAPNGQGSPQAGAGAPGPQGQQQPSQGQPSPGAGQPANAPAQGGAQGQPQPGAGSAQPQPAKSKGGFGQIMDAPGGEAGRAKAEAKAQQNTRQAAMIVKAKGAGKLPGFIQEIIDDIDKPRVDWRATLRRFADDSTLRETCWTRPNRRFMDSPFILPGHESSAPSHVVTIVDTSGSIDVPALQAMGAELQAMLDEQACERITIVYCDTQVRRTDEYATGDMLTMRRDGGGGTYFKPALDWVAENAPDASAIVYLTDLEAYDISSLVEPGAPVLWAVTGGSRATMPFGESIPIDADA